MVQPGVEPSRRQGDGTGKQPDIDEQGNNHMAIYARPQQKPEATKQAARALGKFP